MLFACAWMLLWTKSDKRINQEHARKGGRVSFLLAAFTALAAQQFERMWYRDLDETETLTNRLGAAGKVNDERIPKRSRHGS